MGNTADEAPNAAEIIAEAFFLLSPGNRFVKWKPVMCNPDPPKDSNTQAGRKLELKLSDSEEARMENPTKQVILQISAESFGP
mmetsp:Transcript_6746/g.7825  ORF Transcript_6746/g.7825 Transcript_6746/m.7825 type:complete len:83 (+) Transcript_6746:59-307(+)